MLKIAARCSLHLRNYSSFRAKRARGVKDLWPTETARLSYVERVGSETVKKYGYRRIETPIIEKQSTFSRTLGTDSDIVSKEMFLIQPRSSKNETDPLCLRPEQTAGVMRALLDRGLQEAHHSLLYYYGPMFRYERPQFGRLRQFYQFGIESIGTPGVSSDVEVILMAKDFLRALGLPHEDISLEINSLGTNESRNGYNKTLLQFFKQWILDKKPVSPETMQRIKEGRVLRIFDSKDPLDEAAIEAAPSMMECFDQESKDRIEAVFSNLNALGVQFSHNERLVRGLDYYSHLVFEFTTKLPVDSDNIRTSTIIAGGRYDNLASIMGAPRDVPAIGWAAGIERLILAMEYAGIEIQENEKPQILILPIVSDNRAKDIQEIVHLAAIALRDSGFNIIIPHELNIPSGIGESSIFRKGMKLAGRSHCEYVLIIGSEDHALDLRTFRLRRLSTKAEMQITFDRMIEQVHEFLNN